MVDCFLYGIILASHLGISRVFVIKRKDPYERTDQCNGMSQGFVALVNDCIECPSEDLVRNFVGFLRGGCSRGGGG